MNQSTPVLPFPQTDEDRLRLALRRLNDAVASQSAAVAEFRGQLSGLRQATANLAGQMERYQASLSDTALRVREAQKAAQVLEQSAGKLVALAS